MSFYDLLNKFFNGNSRPPDMDKNQDDIFQDTGTEFNNVEENDVRDFGPFFDFKIATDPLEMHRYFEQKIDEIFRTFATPGGFPGFSAFPGDFDNPDVPAVKEKSDPRDYYLKPGFGKTSPKHQDENVDKHDNLKSPIAWLDKFNSVPSQEDSSSSLPRTFSSFRSVTRKTVTLPDGTVKTEEIIRNSDGTEERRESETLPGGNYPHLESPFMQADFFGIFKLFEGSSREQTYPKHQLLKPGYEKLNPFAEKIDKDLDKEILQSDLKSLPPFTKEQLTSDPMQENQLPNKANQESSVTNITRKTVTLPNGTKETEEILRSSDGTVKRTVTYTLPDGTNSGFSDPNLKSITDGQAIGPNRTVDEERSGPAISLALKGVKDLINTFFK